MAEVTNEKIVAPVASNEEPEPAPKYNDKKEGIEEGDVLDTGAPLTKDGIELFPQPTSDPLDPLNWSSLQKHGILAIVMSLYFMFTYITTTTVPSFPALQEQFAISVDQLNWTVAIPALGLSVGPLVWSSIADIYGRRIIFLIGTIIALASTIGAALAPNYGGYMAARFFQGFGVSPAATVGLAIINDLFFDHERGQKIGWWCLAIDLGIYFGPLFGGFLNIVSTEWIQWFTAILFGAILVAEVFFLPETLYPRHTMLPRMPYSTGAPRGQSIDIEKTDRKMSVAGEVDLKRTKKLPYVNVMPLPGMKHPKPWDSLVRFLILFKFPTVSLSVIVFCFGWYWWILSLMTLLPVAYIQYTPQIQGLLFIGFILGTIVAEIFCSGRLSDWIMIKAAKKNGGLKVAEMRLWLAYPAATLSAIGLILWGISIDKGYHWIVGQIAFFLFAAGIQMGNTAIASYIVDCYPLQSMSIVTFYAVLLNLSAFVEPFFINPWLTASGYTWTMAAQGIITFWFSVPALALIHWKGGAMRRWAGVPNWLNPEFDTAS